MLDTRTFVGVDVAKGHLDVAFPSAKAWRTTNDPVGIATLGRRLAKLEAPHLVCEATGGYTRQLTRALSLSKGRSRAESAMRSSIPMDAASCSNHTRRTSRTVMEPGRC